MKGKSFPKPAMTPGNTGKLGQHPGVKVVGPGTAKPKK